MVFTSPLFLCFAFVSIVLLRAFLRSPAIHILAAFLNLAFVTVFFGVTATSWLFAVTILGYLLFLYAQRAGPAAKILGVGLLVVLFIVMKRYPLVADVPAIESIPQIVGLSFVIFRLIHLVVDAADGDVRAMTPFDFLAYTLFFPTLLSGPVQRYQDFVADRPQGPPRMRDLTRVALGYVKVTVVSPLLLDFHSFALTKQTNFLWLGVDIRTLLHQFPPDQVAQWAWLAAAIFAAMIWFVYLYYNFAGYTDIVIGAARLAGFGLPENFNRPFAANSFLEFWNRWHMSLAQWFRTYVFGPLFKFLVLRVPWPAMVVNALGLFITFFLVGVWHGTTWPFVVFGALLGIGAAANRLYRDVMARAIGKSRLRSLERRVPYQCVCFGLTFLFLAISITPMWMTNEQFFIFLQAFSGLRLVLLPIFLAGTAVFIGLFRLAEARVAGPAVSACRIAMRAINEDFAQALAIGALVNLSLIINIADLKALPTFIYQGF